MTWFLSMLNNILSESESCKDMCLKSPEEHLHLVSKHASWWVTLFHYSDVIMGVMVSQITVILIVYSTVCSGADQRKHQSSTSLAFVRGNHWWQMNSLLKGPVMWKRFACEDTIMSVSKWSYQPQGFPFTETEMLSFWQYLPHWLHWKLSKWQLPMQPVMKILSKWWHSHFSVVKIMWWQS